MKKWKQCSLDSWFKKSNINETGHPVLSKDDHKFGDEAGDSAAKEISQPSIVNLPNVESLNVSEEQASQATPPQPLPRKDRILNFLNSSTTSLSELQV